MKHKLINLFHRKKSWWENPKKRVILIIAVFVLGIFTYRVVQGITDNSSLTNKNKKITVELQSIAELSKSKQIVKATGEVESIDQVELRSEVSARVSRVYVTLGQQVKPGQRIATFYNKDSYASQQDALARVQGAQAGKLQYEATLEVQKTKLQELLRGARPEELSVSKTSADNARKLLEEAKQSTNNSENKAIEDLDKTLASTVSALQRSVQIAIDTIYNASNIQYAYFLNNNQDSANIISSKEQAVEILLGQSNTGNWIAQYIAQLNGGVKEELNYLATDLDESKIRKASEDTIRGIRKTINLFEYMPLTTGMTSTDLAIISNDKQRLQSELSNSVAARDAIDNQIAINNSSIQGSETAYVAAQNALDSAQRQLQLVEAGASEEQIRSQELAVQQADANLRAQAAQVLSARASVSSASAQVDKTIIKSPIAGKIAKLPVRKEELVSPGNIVASVINNSALQIRTFVDSGSLSFISTNADATINGMVSGTITFISPAIDPSTGKVEVIILVDNSVEQQLVVGQYVDVEIESVTPEFNIIQALLPLHSVYITEESTFIFTVNDKNKVEQHEVTLGRVRGKEVEILTGLEEITHIIPSVRDIDPGMTVEIKN